MARGVVTSVQTEMIEGPGGGIIRNKAPRHVPARAWSDGRNIRFYRDGTRVRKIDGFFLHDSTPDAEGVRLIWHYLKSDGVELLIRVGTTRAWSGSGVGRIEIASGLGALSTPITADQFKDDLIWTDGEHEVMRYQGGGAGTAAPLPGFTNFRSRIVLNHKFHILHFNIKEGGVPKPWRGIWSGLGDPTDYVGDTAGDLDFTQTLGGITAAGVLGESVIIHKGELPICSLHRMVFVGAPDHYIQEPIPADDAALSQRALVSYGPFQYYMGHRNFYRLGAFPEPIGDAIWPVIIDELGADALLDYAQRELVFAYLRPEWREICWKLPRVGTTQPDLTVIYNVRDQTWSLSDHDPGTCYGLFPSIITDSWDAGAPGPWDTSPDVPWDFAAYSQTLPLALFGQVDGSIHQYGGMNANGQPIVAFATSREFSSGFAPALLSEVKVRAKGIGTLKVRTRAWMGDQETAPDFDAGEAFALASHPVPWVNPTKRGRLWQIRFETTGLNEDWELEAYGPGVVPGGSDK